MNNQIKPCPFCGAQPTILAEENTACWYVECDCEAQGPHESTSEQAITAWNARHPEQAEQETVAKIVVWLRDEVEAHPVTEYASFAAAIACSIEAGEWKTNLDDREITSKPVDDHETPKTIIKTRDAVEVWRKAVHDYGGASIEGTEAEARAAAIIEADRQATRAALVAEIEAWLRDYPADQQTRDVAYLIADRVQWKWGTA